MVLGIFHEDLVAPEASELLEQVTLPLPGKWSRHASWSTAFTQDGAAQQPAAAAAAAAEPPKPRFTCPPGKDHCFCAEGHRCVMSWPFGENSQGADYMEYMDGCPADKKGLKWISRDHYSKENDLCKDDKCQCVLEREPNNDAPEFVKVPSVDGEYALMKKRYEMPKAFTERFVERVRGGEEGEELGQLKPPVWLTSDKWIQEYPEVKANMNRIMRTMHRKVMAIESMFEVPKTAQMEAKDDPTLGPQPPVVEVPEKPHEQTPLDDEGERASKMLITEFRLFQQQCKRLQQTAQSLGQADDGEGGLNCYDDYKEKKRIEDAAEAIAKIQEMARPGEAEFLSTLKLPRQASGTRNLLTVLGTVRDMGPDENDQQWLPTPSAPAPPVLPEEITKAQENASCPWLTENTKKPGIVECFDGEEVDDYVCHAAGHDQRAKCPPDKPKMCADLGCGGADGGDHCCETDCSDKGGELQCPNANCPWASEHTKDDNKVECFDGQVVDVKDGCNKGKHGQRLKCPANLPKMCADTSCDGDHCCEKDCEEKGGELPCPPDEGDPSEGGGGGEEETEALDDAVGKSSMGVDSNLAAAMAGWASSNARDTLLNRRRRRLGEFLTVAI